MVFGCLAGQFFFAVIPPFWFCVGHVVSSISWLPWCPSTARSLGYYAFQRNEPENIEDLILQIRGNMWEPNPKTKKITVARKMGRSMIKSYKMRITHDNTRYGDGLKKKHSFTIGHRTCCSSILSFQQRIDWNSHILSTPWWPYIYIHVICLSQIKDEITWLGDDTWDSAYPPVI